jgi:hypothetical protein
VACSVELVRQHGLKWSGSSAAPGLHGLEQVELTPLDASGYGHSACSSPAKCAKNSVRYPIGQPNFGVTTAIIFPDS